MTRSRAGTISRVLLALAFIISAFLKLTADGKPHSHSGDLAPLARMLGSAEMLTTIAIIEIGVALGLLSRLWTQAAWLSALVVLSFAGYTLGLMRAGADLSSCG